MKLVTAMRLVVASCRGDAHARYTLARQISEHIDPKYKFSEDCRLYLEDADFLRWYESFEANGYQSLDRKWCLKYLLKLIEAVPGDTAECGVYKGASSYLICESIEGAGRRHHAFDSFEGLSTPEAADGTHWRAGALACSIEEVRDNLKRFDFVEYHRGWIPSSFESLDSDKDFALVHIDVDLYQPTLASLEFFWPQLSEGGLVISDDYGFTSCPGARRAMDEYFAGVGEPIIELSSGQAFVIKHPQSR
jgi:O-methyltransferase